MSKVRVGVLRGGPSPEYEVSLGSGKTVLSNLSPEKYDVHDILIDREGNWFLKGLPLKVEKIPRKIDVLFNALHGTYGEDGQLQSLLDSIAVPYTGSGKLGSALAMNKAMAKRFYRQHGLRTPAYLTVGRDESGVLRVVRDTDIVEFENISKLVHFIFTQFPQPAVLKPISSGSSVGVSVVYGPDEIKEALLFLLETENNIIVEEYIKGREATCGVVDSFKGEDLHALLPVEIIPPNHAKFFDYNVKYDGSTSEICPGNFNREEKRKLEEYAKLAHKALGLRHYSRSDFIVTPRGVFILETNSLPGLTEESLFPKSLSAGGTSLPDFFEHLLESALRHR